MASLPIVGLIGAAVDYSRGNSAKASMQAAIDATALILSKEAATLTNDQLKEKADRYFKANFNRPEAKNIVVTPTYSSAASQLTLDGTATLDTNFVSLLGKDTMTIGATSTIRWGNSRLRVALALDNTGSMAANNKMVALKAAAHKLLDQLQKAAVNNGDVYVSIVPFARDVSIGAGDPKNPNWKAPDWVDLKNDHGSWKSWEYENGTCSGNWHNQWAARNKGNCDGTWTPRHHNTWNGCIADRDEDYDVTNAAPSVAIQASLFPAEQYDACPAPIMPQTFNWANLRAKIDAMTPAGNTNTTIGLEWAWHSLSQNAPLNAPPIVNGNGITTQNIIIFLTDGENTQNRSSSNQKTIDRRMKKACTNAKADVTLYTVLVLEGNETLLKECASPETANPPGPKFFKLTSADQLVTTFQQIGTALSQLRIAN